MHRRESIGAFLLSSTQENEIDKTVLVTLFIMPK